MGKFCMFPEIFQFFSQNGRIIRPFWEKNGKILGNIHNFPEIFSRFLPVCVLILLTYVTFRILWLCCNCSKQYCLCIETCSVEATFYKLFCVRSWPLWVDRCSLSHAILHCRKFSRKGQLFFLTIFCSVGLKMKFPSFHNTAW